MIVSDSAPGRGNSLGETGHGVPVLEEHARAELASCIVKPVSRRVGEPTYNATTSRREHPPGGKKPSNLVASDRPFASPTFRVFHARPSTDTTTR